MVVYVFSTFVAFLTNNVPKTSITSITAGEIVFPMPQIAFTVIPNMSLGISMVDQTYFGVNVSQGTMYQGLSKTRFENVTGTNYNCSPSWLSEMNFTSFMCPSQIGSLRGTQLTSVVELYMKLDFFTCVNSSYSNITCQSAETITNLLGNNARMFVFIQQDSTFYGSDSALHPFKSLFYFPVFEYYQKFEIYLENYIITQKPDFFHSFSTQTKQALFYLREKTYLAEILPTKTNIILTIWLRLNEEMTQEMQVPATMMDLVGSWGALWGVILSVFGLYFLKHNQDKFYSRNKEWLNFGKYTKRMEEDDSKAEISIELSDLTSKRQ